jgi:hypothetical protein
MSLVRQAHLPGNYELADESSGKLGPAICKGCWEEDQRQNTGQLSTFWVSVDGAKMVWYLCEGHAGEMKTKAGPVRLLKSVKGVVTNPGL